MDAFREAQVLVLLVVFLLACVGKTVSPGNRHQLAWAGLEGVLCLLLLVSGHPAVRLATAMILVAATWMLGELKTRRPEEGCGCFGSISSSRIGRRTILRTGLLAAAAGAAMGVSATGARISLDVLGWRGVFLVVELGFLMAISPEPVALLKRTRITCDRRDVPLRATMDVLRGSDAWKTWEDHVPGEPIEVWRELCWRFVVFEVEGGELVFAVSLGPDREVRVTLVEEVSDASETGPNPAYVLV
ncbi:MauE/DoxX family redox-associated membrane protein [Actinocorallia longicatena]|uniref:Methylamine utilisation protein MauE domain-containing protein n=1 Tax=Actinocorallia longicatena TaxID=111803 RepID=A0ABP6Q9J0_9ACTN